MSIRWTIRRLTLNERWAGPPCIECDEVPVYLAVNTLGQDRRYCRRDLDAAIPAEDRVPEEVNR